MNHSPSEWFSGYKKGIPRHVPGDAVRYGGLSHSVTVRVGCMRGSKVARTRSPSTVYSLHRRLYCPADLSEQNKSAGGGDAVIGIPIPCSPIAASTRMNSCPRSVGCTTKVPNSSCPGTDMC